VRLLITHSPEPAHHITLVARRLQPPRCYRKLQLSHACSKNKFKPTTKKQQKEREREREERERWRWRWLASSDSLGQGKHDQPCLFFVWGAHKAWRAIVPGGGPHSLLSVRRGSLSMVGVACDGAQRRAVVPGGGPYPLLSVRRSQLSVIGLACDARGGGSSTRRWPTLLVVRAARLAEHGRRGGRWRAKKGSSTRRRPALLVVRYLSSHA
jgi:hypothetical protein